MSDHDDYNRLSEKIDTMCAAGNAKMDLQASVASARMDSITENVIRSEERQRHIMEDFSKHMSTEDRRWALIIKILIILGIFHVTEFATSYPQLIAALKAMGL